MVIAGIDPRASARQLDGDIIKTGPRGFNNISVRIGRASEGREIWRIDRGAIYAVQYDPAKKTYALSLNPEVTENPWLSFNEPLRIRVIAHTEFDNAYWHETVRPPENLSDPIILDHYSATEGQDDRPMNAAERAAHWARIRGGAPSTPDSAAAASPPPSATAAPAPSREVVMTEEELRREREAMARAAIASGSALIKVVGLDTGIESRLLPGDEPSPARGNIVISTKNEGEPIWAWIKKQTATIGRDSTGRLAVNTEYRLQTSDRLYFDKPVLIRIELQTNQGRKIWTEIVRSAGELTRPILLDRYTGTDSAPPQPPRRRFFEW